MSLVDSIFGKRKTTETPSSLSGLFEEQVVDVPKPRRSHHFPRSQEDNDTNEEAKNSLNQNLHATNESANDIVEQETAATRIVSRKEQDDEEETDRTIFVGNLPLGTTRKSLLQLFKPCGKVQSARLRSVPVTGVKLPPERAGDQDLVRKVCVNTQQIDTDAKSSVQAYVVFDSTQAVLEALKLNNTVVQERHIRVDHARPTCDASRSVFVGNLPYKADEESLQRHFCQGCHLDATKDDDIIEGVRIVRDKDNSQCKGFGYVLFRDRSMVATALQCMNGTTYMKRELRVMVCGRRFKGSSSKKRQAEDNALASNSKKQKKNAHESTTAGAAALKRILTKQQALLSQEAPTKKRRARAEKKGGKKPTTARKAGVSRRAAAEAKLGKRVKKIQKRISKGMGKARTK